MKAHDKLNPAKSGLVVCGHRTRKSRWLKSMSSRIITILFWSTLLTLRGSYSDSASKPHYAYLLARHFLLLLSTIVPMLTSLQALHTFNRQINAKYSIKGERSTLSPLGPVLGTTACGIHSIQPDLRTSVGCKLFAYLVTATNTRDLLLSDLTANTEDFQFQTSNIENFGLCRVHTKTHKILPNFHNATRTFAGYQKFTMLPMSEYVDWISQKSTSKEKVVLPFLCCAQHNHVERHCYAHRFPYHAAERICLSWICRKSPS